MIYGKFASVPNDPKKRLNSMYLMHKTQTPILYQGNIFSAHPSLQPALFEKKTKNKASEMVWRNIG